LKIKGSKTYLTFYSLYYFCSIKIESEKIFLL